ELPGGLAESVVVLGNTAFRLPDGGTVSWMADDPGGKVLAVPCGGKVVLFDAESGRRLRTLPGHAGRVYHVAFAPDGKLLAACNWDGDHTVKLWNSETGEEVRTLKGHKDRISCVAFSRDGKRLASASHDRTVKVWDVEKGQETASFTGHTGAVHRVAFH